MTPREREDLRHAAVILGNNGFPGAAEILQRIVSVDEISTGAQAALGLSKKEAP